MIHNNNLTAKDYIFFQKRTYLFEKQNELHGSLTEKNVLFEIYSKIHTIIHLI